MENPVAMDTQIAFWGPSSSGKTWLFESFIQKMVQMNKALNKYGINIAVFGSTGEEIKQVEPLVQHPTEDSRHQSYRFERSCDVDKIKDEFKRNVNTHTHFVRLIDDGGKKFQKVITEEDRKSAEFARGMVEQSEFIVVALDTASEKNDTTAENKNDEDQDDLVRQLDYLKSLLENSTTKRFVAFCLTKVDVLGDEMLVDAYNQDDGRNTIELLLIKRFGSARAKKITQVIRDIEEKKHATKMFSVSAVGYQIKNGKRIPNLNTDHTGIENDLQWTPLGVDRPFFWLFEMIERKRLAYVSPKRDLFQLLIGKENIRKARLEAYIPYEKLLSLSQQRPAEK